MIKKKEKKMYMFELVKYNSQTKMGELGESIH